MISSNNPITRPSNLTFWYSDSDTISKITTRHVRQWSRKERQDRYRNNLSIRKTNPS